MSFNIPVLYYFSLYSKWMPEPERTQKENIRLLVGDIGGTNTRLALYNIDGTIPQPAGEIRTYSSQAFTGLTAIVDTYLKETGSNVDQAVFGVAGPVDKAKGES